MEIVARKQGLGNGVSSWKMYRSECNCNCIKWKKIQKKGCTKYVLIRKYNSLQTLHETMCEDTVFWDLNYAIKYKSLGTEEIRSKVLKVLEKLSFILRNKLIKLNLKMRENRIWYYSFRIWNVWRTNFSIIPTLSG